MLYWDGHEATSGRVQRRLEEISAMPGGQARVLQVGASRSSSDRQRVTLTMMVSSSGPGRTGLRDSLSRMCA